MKKTIPIYTADVTVVPFKKTLNTIKRENPITLKNIVVKGFHSGDIFKRCYNKILIKLKKNKSLKKDYQIELKDMKLLRQHGMGVN